jgi:hypothetical protein
LSRATIAETFRKYAGEALSGTDSQSKVSYAKTYWQNDQQAVRIRVSKTNEDFAEGKTLPGRVSLSKRFVTYGKEALSPSAAAEPSGSSVEDQASRQGPSDEEVIRNFPWKDFL